jgi:diadenylate cyclase
MTYIQQLFSNMTFKDVLDILIVAILLYLMLYLIKNTRAVQIIKGVGVLIFILLASYLFKLEALYWLLRYSLFSLAVAIPIVFQPELRRALGAIGRGSLFVTNSTDLDRGAIEQITDEIAWTADFLSEAKIGALVIIERETGLQEFVETGVPVDGKISSKLLLSIFMPKSPLHDGAVILRDTKVVAASCYLPLTENVPSTLKMGLGTRHRAALGLTEQTDAVVLIVSEETGAISVARNGKLTRNLKKDELKKILISVYLGEQNNVNKLTKFGGIGVTKLFKKRSGT